MASPRIKSGSYTRLDDFESCPLKARLKYADRVPEPDRGPPPQGKKEWPNDRGSRIHDEAQAFVEGKASSLSNDLHVFRTELFQAQALYQRKLVETEQLWCFDEHWKPVADDDYANTRFRIKIDLNVGLSPNHRLIVDYKTGKRWGNEMKHERQKQTYAIGTFCRMPKVDLVTTELWYTDLPKEDIFPTKLTRKQGMVLLRALDARNQRMLNATIFQPTPSKQACRFCPYNPANRPESDPEYCSHAYGK